MRLITAEWIEKAEGDFAVVERESRARRNPSYDAVCFHAQQCAEKYLKARLCEAGIQFPRTHDLVALLDILIPVEPQWELLRAELAHLSDFAVSYRYPGDAADRELAIEARRYSRSFRAAARAAFGLPT